jgi:AraC-like DNA-binding protein
MYEFEGLNNVLYTMLYGAAAMAAVIAGLYLLLRRHNAISPNITPPKSLRQWAAAFLFASAASHVWWTAVGTVCLADDRLVRNIINLLLDRLTFMPLMMVMLLRMLQDRQRKIWPIAVALLPLVGIAVWGITGHDERAEIAIEYYMRFVGVCFIIYYVRALWQYNRWLHDNFADLQHKEVWQSLVFIACILFAYGAYTVFFVGMTSEFLAQINTFIITGFILWRVETLQKLEIPSTENESAKVAAYIPDNIGTLLKERCEDTKFYLQHDIALAQLALVIGTNRTYLSSYFAQQGITYNAYINRLRIEHFVSLYRQGEGRATLQQLAQQSGYRSYSTFSNNFKSIMGISLAEWVKGEDTPPMRQ